MEEIVVDEIHTMFIEIENRYAELEVRESGKEPRLLRIEEGALSCLYATIEGYYKRVHPRGEWVK